MSAPYQNTRVSAAQTRAEISALLGAYGVTDEQWTSSALRDSVRSAVYRFVIHVGDRAITVRYDFQCDPKLWDAKHRALFWYLKGVLKAVDAEILTLAEVFLPQFETERGTSYAVSALPSLLAHPRILALKAQ